jgi:hypothetical protein
VRIEACAAAASNRREVREIIMIDGKRVMAKCMIGRKATTVVQPRCQASREVPLI